jgi:uncharacterized protein YoxC
MECSALVITQALIIGILVVAVAAMAYFISVKLGNVENTITTTVNEINTTSANLNKTSAEVDQFIQEATPLLNYAKSFVCNIVPKPSFCT